MGHPVWVKFDSYANGLSLRPHQRVTHASEPGMHHSHFDETDHAAVITSGRSEFTHCQKVSIQSYNSFLDQRYRKVVSNSQEQFVQRG